MPHDFLLKALATPDMQDFCGYLEKPLQILEELEYRYKNLPLEKKVKHANMMTHLKMDKITHQHLPNMVENYTQFSIKYRNEEIVDSEKTKGGVVNYTAKEILLKNLAKIVEEIYILESEFNQNNKFELLTQKNYLTNLGYCDGMELEKEKKIVFENKFKYNPHLDIFKKPDEKLITEEMVEKSFVELIDSDNAMPVESPLYNYSAKLILGSVAVLIAGTFALLSLVSPADRLMEKPIKYSAPASTSLADLQLLKRNITNFYRHEKDYSSLTTEVILKAGIIPSFLRSSKELVFDKMSRINVSPETVNVANDSFSLTIGDLNTGRCLWVVSQMKRELGVLSTQSDTDCNLPSNVVKVIYQPRVPKVESVIQIFQSSPNSPTYTMITSNLSVGECLALVSRLAYDPKVLDFKSENNCDLPLNVVKEIYSSKNRSW